MLALWMLYAMLVGTLVTGAAALLDRRLASTGQGRWAWGLALVAALAIPALRPRIATRSNPAIELGAPVVIPVPAEAPAARSRSLLERLEAALVGWDGPLAGAWVGASAVLAALLLWSALGLRRRRSRWWWRAELDGTSVLISDGLGPALVGLTHPEIVVPEWVWDLGPAERAMILAHEEEHRRGRDPAVLALGLLAPVLCPWNPGLWWGFHRLRQAVEADCDHRVLASGLDSPARYARLLLDVGSRVVGIVPVSAGFGESPSSLERRVGAMLGSRAVGGIRGTVIRGAVAATLLLAACMVKNPTAPPLSTTAEERARSASDTTTASLVRAPVFTPYTVGPRILNRAEVVQAMKQYYPPLLRDAGIGGTTVVFFFVDSSGDVLKTQLVKSSGRPELDSAAMKVSKVYRFAPAVNRDRKVSVWVQVGITFGVQRKEPTRKMPPSAPRTTRPIEAAPTFTPWTVRPRILNEAEVVQAMQRSYPPLLRDAGIGGTTVVYFFIDTSGNVLKTQLSKSSGHPQLDSAAMKVAKVYRFSPAMNRDERVPVWVQFGVTFAVH